MDCEWTEKVSALVDEELGKEEASSLREHINQCEICRQAEMGFLILRRELKSYTGSELQHDARSHALKRILDSENIPLWKRRIALPVPALALIILAVIVLGALMASARWRQGRTRAVEAVREEKTIAPPAPTASSVDEVNLARFDHGARARIYKVRLEDAESLRR